MYVTNRPVGEEPSFVGRDALTRTLLLGLGTGKSFALLGGPRSGVTSVLQALTPLCRASWAQYPGKTKLVPVYLDLATFATGRSQQVARQVWEAVKTAVLSPYVQSHGLPPRPRQGEFLRSKEPWTLYAEVASELWQGLAGSAGWCQYVWLCDNVHVLVERGFLSCLDELLAVVNTAAPWAPGAWVLAGGVGLTGHLRRQKKTLGSLRSLNLSPLRDPDVVALAKLAGAPPGAGAEAPLEDDAPRPPPPPSPLPDLALLAQLTGKHPYALQMALAALEADPSMTPETLHRHMSAALEPFFAQLLATFPAERILGEHMLLQWLRHSGGEGLITSAERELGIGPIKSIVDFLEFSGVLEKTMRGSQTLLRADFGLWNAWYAAHAPALR